MIKQHKSPRISIIVAIGKSANSTNGGVIGRGNQLIWKIPDDLKRFRQITKGYPIIMGRKTFESIGRLLPDRQNIIITRNNDYILPEGGILANTLEEAIKKASNINNEEIFIIGGGEIYKQSMSFVDRLYLTIIDSEETGDVFFPSYSEFTKVIDKEKRESEGLKYTWITLDRA